MKTYYITTAIDYTNAKPHIGHAYEKILADFLARWHKLNGNDVFFLTGTDEHGQKIEKAAKDSGKPTKQFVDEIAEYFKTLCQKLNLSNNAFIRTTDKKHAKTAIEIWNKVYEKGLIYKDNYSGQYCVGCEAFLTEKELENGNCPIHKKPAEQLTEETYFFKLSQFQEQIIQHIEQHPDFIQPETRKNEILSRLKEPLKDLCVSRTTFKWGIPIPKDKNHVIYVWFDALINYLSGISYPTTKFKKFWPANCHLIGKDIMWFHTVIWPAILFAAEIELPKTVYCHGWLTINGQKMSKSLGNVLDPVELVEKYGADPVRYTLLREAPMQDDADFSETVLINKNNSDLADALGNLLQRTNVLIQKNFNGNIPACCELTEKENQLKEAIPDIEELNKLVSEYKIHHVIEKIWNYISACNKYINDTEPWKQTQNPERLGTILYNVVEHLRIITSLIWPIIPETAENISKITGQPIDKFKKIKYSIKTTGALAPPEILFKKIEKQEEDIFGIFNLRVAKILDVQNHPEADKLYVLQLDAGEKRQLIAGMKPYYKPEELLGKNIVFISNLKPAVIRGTESQGMMLAGEKDNIVKILEAPNSKPGDQVFIEGITPKTQQITIDDFKKIKLTTKDNQAIYKDKPLMTSVEKIKVDLPDNATIR